MPRRVESSFHVLGKVERAMGIEPTYQAWEARVLPLNYARLATREKCTNGLPFGNRKSPFDRFQSVDGWAARSRKAFGVIP